MLKFFILNLLLALWMLSICLGAAAVFIVAVKVGGWTEKQSMVWMFATLIGLITYPIYCSKDKL